MLSYPSTKTVSPQLSNWHESWTGFLQRTIGVHDEVWSSACLLYPQTFVHKLCLRLCDERSWLISQCMVVSYEVCSNFYYSRYYECGIKSCLISANSHVALSGSDIMRSVAVEAIKTIPANSNWTYLEHEMFGPRLSLDIPQVIFSFVSSLVSYKGISHFRNLINVNRIYFQFIKYIAYAELDSKLKYSKILYY